MNPSIFRRAWNSAAYRIPRMVLAVLSWPVGLLPLLIKRGLCLLVFYGTAHRNPKKAVKELLVLDADLAEYINQASMNYGEGVHVKHRLTRYHDFFVGRIRPGESVVDLGCGYGAVAFSVASRADARVTGIDLSADNIALARKRFQHPNLVFIEGDVLKDLPKGKFETVVFSNVLEHLDQRVAFLKQVQEKLEPRRWLIRVPMFDRDWKVPLRKELGLNYFSDDTHFIEYTTEIFLSEIREAGMQVTHLQVNWGEIWAEVIPVLAQSASRAQASAVGTNPVGAV